MGQYTIIYRHYTDRMGDVDVVKKLTVMARDEEMARRQLVSFVIAHGAWVRGVMAITRLDPQRRK